MIYTYSGQNLVTVNVNNGQPGWVLSLPSGLLHNDLFDIVAVGNNAEIRCKSNIIYSSMEYTVSVRAEKSGQTTINTNCVIYVKDRGVKFTANNNNTYITYNINTSAIATDKKIFSFNYFFSSPLAVSESFFEFAQVRPYFVSVSPNVSSGIGFGNHSNAAIVHIDSTSGGIAYFAANYGVINQWNSFEYFNDTNGSFTVKINGVVYGSGPSSWALNLDAGIYYLSNRAAGSVIISNLYYAVNNVVIIADELASASLGVVTGSPTFNSIS